MTYRYKIRIRLTLNTGGRANICRIKRMCNNNNNNNNGELRKHSIAQQQDGFMTLLIILVKNILNFRIESRFYGSILMKNSTNIDQ